MDIPKGARHLLVQEFKGTLHILGKRTEEPEDQVLLLEETDPVFHVLAVKNQETGQLFLNDEDELPESRELIEKGVVWEYNRTGEQESIQTTGPLKYDVLLMVSHCQKNQDGLCL